VLDALLASGDGFRDTDLVGYMADDWKILLVSFGSGGEIGVVGNHGLDLDEVRALLLQ
jgi:hypothetical protein